MIFYVRECRSWLRIPILHRRLRKGQEIRLPWKCWKKEKKLQRIFLNRLLVKSYRSFRCRADLWGVLRWDIRVRRCLWPACCTGWASWTWTCPPAAWRTLPRTAESPSSSWIWSNPYWNLGTKRQIDFSHCILFLKKKNPERNLLLYPLQPPELPTSLHRAEEDGAETDVVVTGPALLVEEDQRDEDVQDALANEMGWPLVRRLLAQRIGVLRMQVTPPPGREAGLELHDLRMTVQLQSLEQRKGKSLFYPKLFKADCKNKLHFEVFRQNR